ncbi:hypothetical protein IHE45_10G094300 [Dioscorea alata]|uniref:Uncharacterized protein n=1 Tax=Dioscorea alata TaxID=55571 RepID=A0ACB7VD27_DIOAL|nr:hypothetical protein IHE45_10G094300 [Dioscorea alata]
MAPAPSLDTSTAALDSSPASIARRGRNPRTAPAPCSTALYALSSCSFRSPSHPAHRYEPRPRHVEQPPEAGRDSPSSLRYGCSSGSAGILVISQYSMALPSIAFRVSPSASSGSHSPCELFSTVKASPASDSLSEIEPFFSELETTADSAGAESSHVTP